MYRCLILLIPLLYVCSASTPFLAWSNGEVFSDVSANDLLNTRSMLNEIRHDLVKLDFIIVFSAQSLEFDDIARYGGLYGNNNNAPLESLQNVMATAASSVWGETQEASILIEELPRVTYTSTHYLTEMTFSKLLKMTGDLQLLVVNLPNGSDREQTLREHGLKIGHVTKALEDVGAKYAAFYTASHSHTIAGDKEIRDKRSVKQKESYSASAANNDTHLCNKTAILYESDGKGNISFCSLLCIHATTANNTLTNNVEPLLGVYWPSWVNQVRRKDMYIGSYHCNLTSFEFDESTANCSGSSIQDEYLSQYNITSNSITANVDGSCVGNFTVDLQTIQLKVEFIFIDGSLSTRYSPTNKTGDKDNQFIPLPGNQFLLPGYWTMQLVVTNVTGGVDSEPQYMTQYKRNLDNSQNFTTRPGLFYPFTIPYGTSYSCISHKDHIWSVSGNPNRFVPTKIPFDANAKNITDGPLLQFIGLQVQSFGNVYGSKPNTTFLAFSSIYDCQGYFYISSWSGTVVVVIITIMLYLAVLALFSTQTMDRFDDPRGRTITIENLH